LFSELCVAAGPLSSFIITVQEYIHDRVNDYVQMRMRASGEWALDEDDEVEYNNRLETGETSGEGKCQDLVYFLAVQPRQA
jgi:hypothetical protein